MNLKPSGVNTASLLEISGSDLVRLLSLNVKMYERLSVLTTKVTFSSLVLKNNSKTKYVWVRNDYLRSLVVLTS